MEVTAPLAALGSRVRAGARSARYLLREYGPGVTAKRATELLHWRVAGGLSRLVPGGTPVNVFDREWDVLVVLDACRPDTLAEVATDTYEFVTDVETIYSVGSYSASWLDRTFTDAYREEAGRTTYVSGNPFTARTLDSGLLDGLDEVWRDAWDDDRGTVLPRPVTDRAIRAYREDDPDRLIVHYMQPHAPFVEDPDLVPERHTLDQWAAEVRVPFWFFVWAGAVDEARARAAYRRNVERVLEDVALLLENVSGDVAITADHGELIGEHGLYGHDGGNAFDALRRVPWAETTAVDERTRDPDEWRNANGATAEERLGALGYL